MFVLRIAVCCTQQKVLDEVKAYLPFVENWIKEFRRTDLTVAPQLKMKYAVDIVDKKKEEMKRFPAHVALTQA